jgi:hypothetical protein
MAELVAANPGFASRFPRTITFPDYSDEELVAILTSLAGSERYDLTPDAGRAAAVWFGTWPRGRGFGNGRLARNLFEAAVARHASRLLAVAEPTDAQLTTLEAVDVASVPTPKDEPPPSSDSAGDGAGQSPQLGTAS